MGLATTTHFGRRSALAVLLGSAALLLPVMAQPASASASCGDLSISPSSTKVRSGGRITLNGSCSGAAASSGTTQPGSALIAVKGRRGYRPAAQATVGADGSFSTPLRVRVQRGVAIATIRARSAGTAAATVRVGVFPACKQVPKCNKRFGKKKKASPRGLLLNDTASSANPNPIWGSIDCENSSRHQQITSGGDDLPTASGADQGNSAFRRLTVYDGDDYWGERCELGKNDNRGPVALYHEGQRRLTYASFRLPSNFDIDTDMWQGVLQMKQAQPADNGGGTPVISLGAYDGKWLLFHSGAGYTDVDNIIWEAPASNNQWTRMMIDSIYSQDPSKGVLKMSIDLNGDGDFDDAGEQSPTFHTNTLKREIAGDDSDGMTQGESIPSHLRVGMYHNPGIPCLAGCSVDVDNVQVIAP
jgi:hypothetical protein